MTHANPNTHTHSNMRWHLSRNPRWLWWEMGLVFAIILTLAFLATRADASVLTKLSNVLGRNQPSASDEPAIRPTNLATVSDLIAQLKDPVSSVRLNAAQALAAKHAIGATDALIAATYDSNARVREEAAAALGDIGSVRALPRMEELQVTQGNIYVEAAAFEAQGKIIQNIAQALQVPVSSVEAWGVAENGPAYASALDELYALRGDTWQEVGQLPATPNEFSVGPDGRLLFMSTDSAGLYRSRDSGQSWEHIQYGMQTPTQLRTTAVVMNPQNVDQIFVALAVNGSTSAELNSLGIVESNDGGKGWVTLEDAPSWSVTTALVFDRTAPIYLYGLTDVGPWRYQILPNNTNSQ